jgi:lipopolysaccharide exporter
LDILRLLFGHQWDVAAPLVPIFCLGGAIGAINSLTPAQLIATGKVAWVTRLELVVQPARLLFLVFALSHWATPAACAWAYVAAAAFGVPIYQVVRHRALPIPVATFVQTLLKSLGVALSCVAPALLVTAIHPPAADGTHGLGVLIVSVGLGIPMAVVAAHLFRHPVAEEPMIIKLRLAAQQRVSRFLRHRGRP